MRDGQATVGRQDAEARARSVDCGIAATRSALLLVLMDTRTPGEAWRDTVRAAASVASAAGSLARTAGALAAADRLQAIARALDSLQGLAQQESVERIHRAILGCGAEVVVAP